MKVPTGIVTQEMIDLLGDNWFKLRPKTDEERDTDMTRDTLKKMRVGSEVGLKDFVLLLWRNESSIAYLMEGRQLWEKKAEYHDACRTLLKMLCASGDWSGKKGIETIEDRWDVLVNILVRDALELNLPPTKKKDETGKEVTVPGTNGVDKKGSYAMFVLKLVAPELRANVKKNRVDVARFFGVTCSIEDLMIDIDMERAEDDEELFESTPIIEANEEPEAPPPMSEEELSQIMEYYDTEDSGWIPPMDDGWVPEDPFGE